MEGFQEEKQGEQSHKLGREVIPWKIKVGQIFRKSSCLNSLEDSEGKTSLSDRIPAPLHKMLKLCCSQLAKEQLPHQLAS